MIVRMNGVVIQDEGVQTVSPCEMKKVMRILPRFKALAGSLWALSGSLFSRSIALAASQDASQPLIYFLQDMALQWGALAIIAGLIILAFRKRMGKQVLIYVAIIVGGAFLAPALITLFAIISGSINDSLQATLMDMRHSKSGGAH